MSDGVDWKNLALHLLNCTAATVQGFPKSTSKGERRRHQSILSGALKMLDGDIAKRQEDADWIRARAETALKALSL